MRRHTQTIPPPYAVEYRVVRGDGSVRWVFAKGRANSAGSGSQRRIISFDGTLADITERKRAEEALRASEERYRRLVETAYEGVWTIDAGGGTTYVNRRMAELLGYAPEEMIGRVHTDFMWEQDRPKGDVDMEGRRQGTAAVWDQRYRRKDGGELWTVASCARSTTPTASSPGRWACSRTSPTASGPRPSGRRCWTASGRRGRRPSGRAG